jgi:hypothetical protein
MPEFAPPSVAVSNPLSKPVDRPSAWHLLFDDPTKATDELAAAVSEKGVLKALPDSAPRMSAAANKFLLGSVVGAIENVLSAIGVGGMLKTAWANMEQVEQALQATKLDGTKRDVSVMSHTISSKHSPRIDMLINEVPRPLLHLLFDASFVIKGCDIAIVAGEIDKITLGHVSVVASLATSGITVIKHQIEKLDLSKLFAEPEAEIVATGVDAAAAAAGAQPT